MSDATLSGATTAPVTPKQAVPGLVAAAAGPLGLNAFGWMVWLMAIIVPLIAFGAAFVVGRRRGMLGYALAMRAGLGVVAACWLNIVAYTTMNAGSLLG